jgi:signal transduction histidine kinase
MNILLADDDPVSRRLMQGQLQKWGHAVVTAADGAEAWRLFEAGDFPIVITDWIMPELDGVELIRRIRACPRPGYVYAMLVTARSQREDLIAGMEAGADDFVGKPLDTEEFRVRVREGERIIRLEQTLAQQNRALRQTQAALVQSAKLAGLVQLAAGLAHEINNPIAYVVTNLAVLQREVLAAMDVLDEYRAGRPDAAARLEAQMDLPFVRDFLPRLFETTQAGLRRVRDIVGNLRDFARLDEADFQEADLNAAVRATLEILGPEFAAHKVRLQTHLGELPPVLCHPAKINQVFLNVLLNAVQACAPGGTVEVRTALCPEGVEVAVRDDGSGIAPEHLPRLFEPFFTTRPVGQGKGLGLAVSFGIVRDHGGSIDVESAAGKGSVFRIRLPLRPPFGKEQ